ncbi:MAG: hypothetical protein LCI00_16345 [Chloroflexi bacterium]|nr:hypothetical protein [Chloroflexota bacterium]MCC6892803.1 hypothetical protein [Anaerolineae bacterium]
MKAITDITSQGIHYIDDENNPQFIDFEICYQKFLTDMGKDINTDDDSEFYKKWKSVGVRYAFGNPPSIVFFTVPSVELKFPIKDNYWEVLAGIKKAGYRTTDGE